MNVTLMMEAFNLWGRAAGALAVARDNLSLARGARDVKDVVRAIRDMRRGAEANRDAKRLLLSMTPITDRFGQELFDQLQKQRLELTSLQSEIPQLLKEWLYEPLPLRVSRMLAISKVGLKSPRIAYAINTENRAITEALADWRIAMGSPAVWVISPALITAEDVTAALQTRDNEVGVRFFRPLLGFGRWSQDRAAA